MQAINNKVVEPTNRYPRRRMHALFVAPTGLFFLKWLVIVAHAGNADEGCEPFSFSTCTLPCVIFLTKLLRITLY